MLEPIFRLISSYKIVYVVSYNNKTLSVKVQIKQIFNVKCKNRVVFVLHLQ